jgi:hypothetical protein
VAGRARVPAEVEVVRMGGKVGGELRAYFSERFAHHGLHTAERTIAVAENLGDRPWLVKAWQVGADELVLKLLLLLNTPVNPPNVENKRIVKSTGGVPLSLRSKHKLTPTHTRPQHA